MYITRFTYEYTPYIRSINMIVTSRDAEGHPMGYEVWPSVEERGRWIVDDEPTIIVHPILSEYNEGCVRRVTT